MMMKSLHRYYFCFFESASKSIFPQELVAGGYHHKAARSIVSDHWKLDSYHEETEAGLMLYELDWVQGEEHTNKRLCEAGERQEVQ